MARGDVSEATAGVVATGSSQVRVCILAGGWLRTRVRVRVRLLSCRSIKLMYEHKNAKNDEPAPLIADDVYKVIMEVRTPCPHVQVVIP
jgi:hypothetical protein